MSAFEGSSSLEEAASIVAGLRSSITYSPSFSPASSASSLAAGSKKRAGDASADFTAATSKSSGGGKKKQQPALDVDGALAKKPKANKPPPMDATGLVFANPVLKPHPFFYYSDHSLEQDDDPLTPITAAGIVPTFPAKMHAILANPELADVVGWDPHGRSWRILKPRDFEIRILPRYFEHSKFSSFVRQANGWGFRRMSEGPDKNAYYHEYFLRAMPWLCKKMRRPKVAEKKAIDPEMEPDLNAISLLFPVPDGPPTTEVLVLQKTIEMGPRARMPVIWDTFHDPVDPSLLNHNDGLPKNTEEKIVDTLKRISTSCGDLKPAALPNIARSQWIAPVSAVCPPQGTGTATTVSGVHPSSQSTVAVTTVLNLDGVPPSSNAHSVVPPSARDTPLTSMESPNTQCSTGNAFHVTQSGAFSSDNQIAASFVAASAIHAHHIQVMLSNAFVAGTPVSEAVSQTMSYAAAATAARMEGSHHEVASINQISQYLRFQLAQHITPRVNSDPGYDGVSNIQNSLSAEAIQHLQQFPFYHGGTK